MPKNKTSRLTTKQKLLSYNNQKAKLAYRQAGIFFCQVCSACIYATSSTKPELLSVKKSKN